MAAAPATSGNTAANSEHIGNGFNGGLPSAAVEDRPSLSAVAADEEPVEPGHGTCTVSAVGLNILNCTVGSGILGLPYALRQMGFWLGIAGTTFSAVLTNLSLLLIVHTARAVRIYQYAPLAGSTLGKSGSRLLTFAVVFNGFGCAYYFYSMVSYKIIIADVLPVLVKAYTGLYGIFASRSFLLITSSTLCIFPLLVFRNIGKLETASFYAALCLPLIILTVTVRAPVHWMEHSAPLTFSGDHVFPALGIVSFAFVSAHVSLMNYLTLKDPSEKSWLHATAFSTTLAFITSLSFALVGYLTFGNDVTPNILSAFPEDDHWINFGRLVVAISLVFTYPMQAYPARACIHQVLGHLTPQQQPTNAQHWAVTISIFLLTMTISLVTSDLGKVYEIVGAFCASAMSYIIPGAMYIATFWGDHLWTRNAGERPPAEFAEGGEGEALLGRSPSRPPTATWRDVSAVVLVVFGVVALVAGTGGAIVEIGRSFT